MRWSKVRKALHFAASFWWGSLPFRVVILIISTSLFILALGGVFLMNEASKGIWNAKRQECINEAEIVFNKIEKQMTLRSESGKYALSDRLNKLASRVDNWASNYKVIVEGPVSTLASPGLMISTVPDSLKNKVKNNEGTWLTPTQLQFAGSTTPKEPGIVIGTKIYSSNTGEQYPVYLVFSTAKEVTTLDMVRQAVFSTGILLIIAVSLTSYFITLQIIKPVRTASSAARRIASGNLDERLEVKGSDDLASLAASMNNMAVELQTKIVRLQELSTLQRRFVSDVSHELRTPLTTVKMASDVVYDTRSELNPFIKRSVEIMHNELERFEGLLSDLLEISRIDAGAVELNLESHDLVGLVSEEIKSETQFAQKLGTQLRMHADGPAIARMDDRRIRRIIRNLLTNAIEHGESNPIDITVVNLDTAVAVSIRDYGIGFDEVQAKKVFERFWRADPSRNRLVGGTGLGLAISLEDARLHNGWLSALGKPGKGAFFKLTLPKDPTIKLKECPALDIPKDLASAEESFADG